MIEEGEKWRYISVKNISRLLHETESKHNDATLWIVFIHSEQKANLGHMIVCARIIITAM